MASGAAGDPMGVDQTMGAAVIVAGVGCRRGAGEHDIAAALAAALARAGIARTELSLIATSARKGSEPGITATVATMGLPLVLVTQDELEAAGPRTATISARVLAVAGVPSVAEAAALAAAGAQARLLAPRIAVGAATCALADTGATP
jgi:cobalt-precorrin 5A hydrolase